MISQEWDMAWPVGKLAKARVHKFATIILIVTWLAQF